VRFLGWREDIDAVLRGASVHCCPSQPEQREGFGITVVEAKRAGIPSVVCPSGALPELVQHQRDGYITAGFDAAAIADGLAWCVADDSRLAHAQEAALASARHYDPAVFERMWQSEFGLGEHSRSSSNACALADARGAAR
jgi:glycosyltransferase involved in cell wall biosynthesis